MEQIVDAAQGIRDPEFLTQNTLSVLGPQRADAIGLGRFGQKTRFEWSFFLRREGGRSTGLAFDSDGLQAMISVGIHPALYERATASQGPCDRRGILTFERQYNGSIAISLLGTWFLAAPLPQLRQVLRVVKRHLHRTDPPVFSRVCQML